MRALDKKLLRDLVHLRSQLAAVALASAFGLSGAWNDASLTLTPGTVRGVVLDRLDRLLARYGGLGGAPRRPRCSSASRRETG